MPIPSRTAFAFLLLVLGSSGCSESAPAGDGSDTNGGGTQTTNGTGGVPNATGSGGTESTGGAPVSGAGGNSASGGGTPASGGVNGAGGSLPPIVSDGGIGPFGGLNVGPASNGGTITFQGIGASGWFPSRRDPASNMCDAYRNGDCCMAKLQIGGDQLTPWDEDLIVTLRGPMVVKQFVVYQQADAASWQVVSSWDARSAGSSQGIAFNGNATAKAAFAGPIGSKCLVDVSTDQNFACGAGSNPFCPTPGAGQHKYKGWPGSKMFVMLASMPHVGTADVPDAQNCSNVTTDNWYDAPWIGISHGELIREGAFSPCNCYGKDPANGAAGDGCGQINAFEIVNDQNAYKNLEVFSTNFFGYQGYIGEGPCGSKCNAATLGADIDLIDKAKNIEAAKGAISMPGKGPGAAFRRPSAGYRYFVVLLDVPARTVQMGIVHPDRIPATAAPLLPSLPLKIEQATVDAVLALRLPH